ncbi:hypothetical protein SK128_012872 [Halocaridina rubra]|uniref:Uncharacterized protein n=1 Tax=Halocaridina rubra TaxID=373956 RepID=A0AAN9AAF5_HALRR
MAAQREFMRSLKRETFHRFDPIKPRNSAYYYETPMLCLLSAFKEQTTTEFSKLSEANVKMSRKFISTM